MTDLIAQAVTYGETTIQGWQANPPAGSSRVAFRPNCEQLVPVAQDGVVSWTLPMPDGVVLTLSQHPPMDAAQAHLYLQAEGNCKIGGDTVPIIYQAQLPQRSIAAPLLEASDGATLPDDLAPTAQPQGGGPMNLIFGSVALLAIAAGVVAFSRRKPKPLGAGPAGPAPETNSKKPQPPERAIDRRNQLDDLLGGRK